MADNAWRQLKARLDDMIQIHTAFCGILQHVYLPGDTVRALKTSSGDPSQNRSDGT